MIDIIGFDEDTGDVITGEEERLRVYNLLRIRPIESFSSAVGINWIDVLTVGRSATIAGNLISQYLLALNVKFTQDVEVDITNGLLSLVQKIRN
jgi:hypothetical protein